MKNNFVSILRVAMLLPFVAATIPVLAADLRGPDTVELDRLPGPYGPVPFSHGRHAAQFADGCGDCHHQHSEFDRPPCKRCHAIDAAQFKASVVRSFRPCANCHGDYDPAVPDVPDLKVAYHQVCFTCHKGIGGVGTSPKRCDQQCHRKK